MHLLLFQCYFAEKRIIFYCTEEVVYSSTINAVPYDDVVSSSTKLMTPKALDAHRGLSDDPIYAYCSRVADGFKNHWEEVSCARMGGGGGEWGS